MNTLCTNKQRVATSCFYEQLVVKSIYMCMRGWGSGAGGHCPSPIFGKSQNLQKCWQNLSERLSGEVQAKKLATLSPKSELSHKHMPFAF